MWFCRVHRLLGLVEGRRTHFIQRSTVFYYIICIIIIYQTYPLFYWYFIMVIVFLFMYTIIDVLDNFGELIREAGLTMKEIFDSFTEYRHKQK